MEERKGLLTNEQHPIVEKAIKFKNPFLEMADGILIKALDDVLLDKLMDYLEKNYPEITPFIYEGVDVVVTGLE